MENTNSRNVVIGIIIIIILAVGAAWWLNRGQEGIDGTATTTPPTFEAAQEANESATIEVNDQFPGDVVYISRATLPAGGWIVVRRDNAGAPGAIIGSTYFDVNARVGNVQLSEPTVEGQRYYVQVYTDNRDGVFNETEDTVVRGANGQPLTVTFTATRTLPELKG